MTNFHLKPTCLSKLWPVVFGSSEPAIFAIHSIPTATTVSTEHESKNQCLASQCNDLL